MPFSGGSCSSIRELTKTVQSFERRHFATHTGRSAFSPVAVIQLVAMNNTNDSIWPSSTRHRFSRPSASPLPEIPDDDVTLDAAIDDLLRLVVERDPDFYTVLGPDGEVDPARDVITAVAGTDEDERNHREEQGDG